MVERNMCNAVMRGIAVPPGSKSTSRANGLRRNLGYPTSGRRLRVRSRVRRSASGRRKQGLALGGRQLCKRVAEILEFHPAVLLRRRFQAVEVAAVGVLDFAAPLAIFRPEQVAEDGE